MAKTLELVFVADSQKLFSGALVMSLGRSGDFEVNAADSYLRAETIKLLAAPDIECDLVILDYWILLDFMSDGCAWWSLSQDPPDGS
ncbi:MAG: hypothetical protein ACRDIA_08315, partial [Actinomycetota bacterium]